MRNKICIFLFFLLSYTLLALNSITAQNQECEFSFKSKSVITVTQPVVRLKISNGTNVDETILYSNPSASNGYDGYDSPKFFNASSSMPEIYTVAGSELLAINGLNAFMYDTEYPLGILIVNATVGTYTIWASQFNNFPTGAKIQLKDKLNPVKPDSLTDLSTGKTYSFSSGAQSYNTARFAIIFKSPGPTITTSGTLSAVNTNYGSASSTTSFTVSGSFLTNDITVSAPSGYEISQTNGGTTGFATSQTLVQSGGIVAQTTIYVRLASNNVTGTYSGNVSCVSSGASTVNVATVASLVSPKSLSIAGLTGVSKPYDGNNSASFTGTPVFSGFVNGENFVVSGSPVSTFENALVGVGKTITVNGYNAPTSNYAVISPTLIANITPIALTINGLTGVNKPYDGNNSASYTGTPVYSGFVNGENFVVSGSPVSTFENALVGVGKIITVNGFNAPTSNYAVISPTLTADITPITLTINGLTGVNKPYDGNNSASFTGTAAYFGLVYGENFVVSGSPVSTFENALVGIGKTITVNGFNAPTSNYTVISPTLTADITPIALTINDLTGVNKSYDGNNSASFTGTPIYSGFVNGENFVVSGSPVSTFENALVGVGKTITVNGFNAPTSNYTVISPTLTADITPINATISTSCNIGSLDLLEGTDLTVLSAVRLDVNTNSTVHSITLNPRGEITLEQDITLNTEALILASDSTGTATFVDNGGALNAVTTNVQQYLTAGRNWYVSSPVSNATSSVLEPDAQHPVFFYNEASGTNAPWSIITDMSTPLSVMKGYVDTVLSNKVITFTGDLNTDNQSVSLTRTSGQNKEGFNLVGNPYPSYLDWNQVSKTNIMTSLWYRTKTAANNYTFETYNSSGGIGTSNGLKAITNLIPPMQAFWVRVNQGSTSGTLSVSNSQRAHIDNNSNIFKTKSGSASTEPVLRLEVSNGTNSDQALVYFNAKASNRFDEYDSPKMSNETASIPEIYTLAGSEQVVINGVNDTTQLTLGFTTGEENDFIIKVSQFENFTSGTQIVLRDNLLNYEQDLTFGDYNFHSGVTANNESRFTLFVKAPSIATELDRNSNADVWISLVNNQIVINGTNSETSIVIYNSIGQRVVSKRIVKNTYIDDCHLTPGVYTIVIANSGRNKTTKLIIK